MRLFENMRIKYLRSFIAVTFPLILLSPGKCLCGTITGIVLDSESGKGVERVSIVLAGHPEFWAETDSGGLFFLRNVPPGEHSVIARIVGYHECVHRISVPQDTSTVSARFTLIVRYHPLPEIVVTPGRYEVLAQESYTVHSAGREEIKSIAGLGEDFYRTLVRFPGVTANDFSARFNVRGGENNEVLALIDGQELYEPFHLKDYGGVLSMIDMEAIGKVNLITGGFPVEYGDRMSGVLDMESFVPNAGEHRTMLGISFTSARFLTEGTFGEGRGNWLVSLRRGYLDIILDLVDYDTPANSIRYYDGFGRVQYTFNKGHSLLFDFLQAGDFTEFIGDDLPRDLAVSRYGNSYLWSTWKYTPAPTIFLVSQASFGRLTQKREGTKYFDFASRDNPFIEDYTTDDRIFTFGKLSHSLTASVGRHHLVRGGIEYQYGEADYDYFISQGSWIYKIDRFVASFDTSDTEISPGGSEFAAYLSDQWHIWGPFTSDLGIRYDYHGYLKASRISPRWNFMTQVRRNIVFRTSFGYYHQAPVLNALPLHEPFRNNPRYGRFDDPAEARQYIAGIHALLPFGIELRAEGYYKTLIDVPPRFESLNNNLEIFPETQDDRRVYFPTGGKSRGFEIFLNRTLSEKWGFWADYIVSRVTDTIENRDVPRAYDQRHQIAFDVNYRPNNTWNFHVGYMYHSGRPQTPVSYQLHVYDWLTARVEKTYGALYSARLPSYSRFDLKVIRKWELSHFMLSGFIEIINLFGSSNVRRWEYWYRYRGGTTVETYRKSEKWLPFLPSLGLALEF